MKSLEQFLHRATGHFDGSELPALFGADKIRPDYTGVPKLSAGQLVKPGPIFIKESAGAIWSPVDVLDRTVRIFRPNESRQLFYHQNPLSDSGTNLIANKRCSQGQGYIDLPRGSWLVNTPIIVSEGTQVEFVLQDAALGNQYDVSSATGDSSAATPPIADPVLVWTTFAQQTIAAADSAVAAANPNRKAATFFNASAGGQLIAITTENPATAFTRGILFLPQGFGVTMHRRDGLPNGILRGWASAAGALLNYAEAI
jgi:hypothetical protein